MMASAVESTCVLKFLYFSVLYNMTVENENIFEKHELISVLN
jgi:hypothetical protein